MKKTISLIAACLFMVAPAMAQTATSNSESFSQSGAIINQSSQSIQQAPGVSAPGFSGGGIESCPSSGSAGLSMPGFGISFGGTGAEAGCDARLDARTLVGVGLKRSAILRLCEREKMALAMAQSGEFICPQIRFAEQPRQTRQVTRRQQQVQAAPARQSAPVRQAAGKRVYDASSNTWVSVN